MSSKGCIGWMLFFKIAIFVVLGIGWIKCIINAASCNFEPIGKAEVIYTVGCFVPPVGGVIGWIDIEDK